MRVGLAAESPFTSTTRRTSVAEGIDHPLTPE